MQEQTQHTNTSTYYLCHPERTLISSIFPEGKQMSTQKYDGKRFRNMLSSNLQELITVFHRRHADGILSKQRKHRCDRTHCCNTPIKHNMQRRTTHTQTTAQLACYPFAKLRYQLWSEIEQNVNTSSVEMLIKNSSCNLISINYLYLADNACIV